MRIHSKWPSDNITASNFGSRIFEHGSPHGLANLYHCCRASTSSNMKSPVSTCTFARLSCHYTHIHGPSLHQGLTYAASRRTYATQSTLGGSSTRSRKQITVVNDDGRVRWKDLSSGEKAARTAQQTFNFGLVLLGFVMTVRQRPDMVESSSIKLTQYREALCISYIKRSLLRIAKRAISTAL